MQRELEAHQGWYLQQLPGLTEDILADEIANAGLLGALHDAHISRAFAFCCRVDFLGVSAHSEKINTP
eukprot:SAG11_NODE_16120_length_556_cov_1.126915_1_plen_67_part_10